MSVLGEDHRIRVGVSGEFVEDERNIRLLRTRASSTPRRASSSTWPCGGGTEALGRGFVKLACGGWRDETDLRGHNRTWKDAQSGRILRELRRVGSKDPVFVLNEIDKLSPAPAAVLLEVLDPAQNDPAQNDPAQNWS